MVRKGYTPEQIIGKLREAEILLNQGATIGEASRKIGVTEQTYYRWRKEYGGLRIEQAKRLKGLEKENARPGDVRSSSRSRKSLVFHRDGHVQYSIRPERPSGVYYVSRMKKRCWWLELLNWRLSMAGTDTGELQPC